MKDSKRTWLLLLFSQLDNTTPSSTASIAIIIIHPVLLYLLHPWLSFASWLDVASAPLFSPVQENHSFSFFSTDLILQSISHLSASFASEFIGNLFLFFLFPLWPGARCGWRGTKTRANERDVVSLQKLLPKTVWLRNIILLSSFPASNLCLYAIPPTLMKLMMKMTRVLEERKRSDFMPNVYLPLTCTSFCRIQSLYIISWSFRDKQKSLPVSLTSLTKWDDRI